MSTLREIKEFLWAFNGQWLTRMSGPMTVPFTAAALCVSMAKLKLLFAILAIACALVASFGVWVVEYRKRKALEENTPITKEDWAKLAAQFSLESKYLTATWNRWGSPGQEKWTVGGKEKFRALLLKAGTTLLNSPKIRKGLSQCVRDAATPIDSWLYFLKENKKFANYAPLVEDLGNGVKAGIYSGIIDELAQRSEATCIECEAAEIG
jgi:hypothetical protein